MKPALIYISKYGKRPARLLLIFLKAVGVLLLLILGIVWLALQMPLVQTKLAQKLSENLSAKLKYKVFIDKVRINWVDVIELNGLRILDREGISMLFFQEIKIDFSLSGLLNRNIFIDQIQASGAKVHLRRSKRMSKINIGDFGLALDSLLNKQDAKPSVNPAVLSIGHISILESNLIIDDERYDSLTDRFDYHHIGLDNITILADNFRSRRDTVEFQMDKLKTVHKPTGLQVHEFKSFFRYTKHNINLFNLSSRIGQSYFSDTIALNFDTPDDFSNFNQKIKIKANLKNSKIAFSDIGLFAPSVAGYVDIIRATGQLEGFIDNLEFKNMLIGFGKNSFLAGRASLRGLPKIEETFAAIKLKNCLIYPYDLVQYIKSEQAFETVSRLGLVKFQGDFQGFTHDFVAHGKFDTEIGKATTDLRLAFLSKQNNLPFYEGKLQTDQFDLGTLLDRKEYIRKLSMNAGIKGSGFDIKIAKLKIKADIKQIELLGYDYKNLKADASLSRRLFEGTLIAADTNLKMDMYGKIDLTSPEKQFIDITGQISKARLYALGFSKIPLDFHTQADLHLSNSKKEGILGQISLNDLVIKQNKITLDIGNLKAFSVLDKNQNRSFALRSEFADIDAQGNFYYQHLYKTINYLIQSYKKIGARADSKLANKDLNKLPSQEVNFNIELKKINPILYLFDPKISVSAKTKLFGYLSNDAKEADIKFFMEAYSDTIKYAENIFQTNQLEISSSKSRNDTGVVAELYFFSKTNRISGIEQTKNLLANMSWQNNKINFRAAIAQQKGNNNINIEGMAALFANRIDVVLKPSQIELIGQKWGIDSLNYISIKPSFTQIRNLRLSNGSQSISIDGTVSRQANQILHLAASGLDLAMLDSLSTINISGIAFANLDIAQVLGKPEISGHVLADSLSLSGFLIGNLNAQAGLEQNFNRLKLLFNIERGQESKLHGQGFYYLDKRKNPLDMAFTLDQVSIKLLEPFLKQNLSQWQGSAAGYLTLGGSFSRPLLNGELQVSNGGFMFNLLKTKYSFDDKIIFLDDEINFDKVILKDQNNNIARINSGAITHTNFSNFGMRLDANLQSFQVMNLGEKDNKMYYGTANVSGGLRINGLFSNLDVGANVRSEKGTRIFIPVQSNEEKASSQDFISFKTGGQLSDTNAIKADTAKKIDLSGINLNFNLDITPDAYCEIIFDKRAGDIIKANGTGKIKLGINTRGDFNIFGQYFINKGTYNFTLKKIASKEFNILPGGSVVWNGDPLGAVLNLSAIYQTNVRLAPLIPAAAIEADTNLLNQPEVRRKYPVNVNLHMEGNMLGPQITVGVNILNYPAVLATYITAFKARVITDEQELNRQVFSLLIFRSFMSEGGFSGAGINAGNSISELVSNQLSGWLSQVNENMEIDVDMNGLSQDALSTLRARLSYTMLNGRLRVTRDGTFTNSLNQATTASVVGDWMVEYLLNKDGSLRAKLFHRNNPNNVVGTGLNTNFTQQGFSLFHTKSFESLPDLFRRKKKRKIIQNRPDDETNNAE